MSESKSSVIHQICKDESSAKSMYRFLKNEKVTEQEIIKQTSQECSENVAGLRVLAFIDTSVVRLSNKQNRLKDLEGLYPTGKDRSQELYGFHISPVLVFDEASEFALGISHTKIIERKAMTRREIGLPRARYYEDIERKESYKWLEGCIESEKVLEKAAHVKYIMDREADIIELLDRIPNKKTSLLVRSNYDRRTIQEDGSTINLKELLLSSKVKGEFHLQVKSKKRKKRKAVLELKYEQVMLAWPKGKQTRYKENKEGIIVTVIEVKEKEHKGYKQEPELKWRLISSDIVQSTEKALEEVEFYSRRWKIEEFFKLLKTDGYDIEGTELTKGKSIRKLTLLVMKASIKVLKLKAVRDGTSEEKIISVFNKDEIRCLKLLNDKLEGKTEKQKNPHDVRSLSFASWVIARLGGWKEFYNPQRPPGSKTFIIGIEKFDAIMIGFMVDK